MSYDPLKVVFQVQGTDADIQLQERKNLLDASGIQAVSVPGHGVVYGQRKSGMPPIYVVDRNRKRAEPVNQATVIFERYQDERCVGRLYVRKEDQERAMALID